ncbi:MAG: tyrosine-type recombinase/integrase [Candidatus Bathyarchaeia archaeon]|jgi:integrase
MAGPTEPAKQLTEPAYVSNEIDLLNYIQHMKNNGRAENTYKARLRSLRQLARQCNLREPETVKATIANMQLKKSTKHKITNSYGNFLEFLQIKWTPPTYKPEETLPFIPLEKEIDEMIAALGTRKAAPLVQLLKDTGMRGEEATLLKWTSIDTIQKTINIQPAKGSNPRILPISDKTLAMLNRLPKKDERIFYQPLHCYRTAFCKQRKDIAKKLNNQRLLKIGFHTLRHWKGTTEYHKTKDIKHVQYILGHKHSDTTDVYINLEQATFLSNTDEWNVKVSHTTEEEIQLIEAGFTLVRTINEQTAIYKKRK